MFLGGGGGEEVAGAWKTCIRHAFDAKVTQLILPGIVGAVVILSWKDIVTNHCGRVNKNVVGLNQGGIRRNEMIVEN